MEQYVKLIDKNNIEYAPQNIDNISNFNLNTELMYKYGYRPLQIPEMDRSLKYPGLNYYLKDDIVYGIWVENPPSIDTIRQQKLKAIEDQLKDQFNTYKLYVDNFVFNYSQYSTEELSAMILSGEVQTLLTHENKEAELNTEQITKLLRDKLKTKSLLENNYSITKQKINTTGTLEELEETNLSYPVLYYKINDLGNRKLRSEMDIDTSQAENVMTISVYRSDETSVFYCDAFGINGEDYLIKNNIPMVKLTYNSGNIVGMKGDLNFSITCRDNTKDKLVMESLCESLKSFGMPASVSGNDILLDDKKCCGGSNFVSIPQDKFYRMYIHLSFYLDTELIEKVRVKPKEKEITCLSLYKPDITQDEVITEFGKKLNEFGLREF